MWLDCPFCNLVTNTINSVSVPVAQQSRKTNIPGFRRQRLEEYLLKNFNIIRSNLTLNIKKSIVSKIYIGRNFDPT